MQTKSAPTVTTEQGEPAWDIARLFPNQGEWSEQEYLTLPTNHLVEYSDGHIEVLPMPTQSHQFIVLFLYEALKEFLQKQSAGIVLVAPIPVRLWDRQYREPDVAVMLSEHNDHRHEQYWDVPDLVVEVISPSNREHDLKTKRDEYARAGIPEYWIVDPEEARITVLTLNGDAYHVHGYFNSGDTATSVLLDGFEVSVKEVWTAAELSQ